MDEQISDLCHQEWQEPPFLGREGLTRENLGWAAAGEPSGASLPSWTLQSWPLPLCSVNLSTQVLSFFPESVAWWGWGDPQTQGASSSTINVAQMPPCPAQSLSPDPGPGFLGAACGGSGLTSFFFPSVIKAMGGDTRAGHLSESLCRVAPGSGRVLNQVKRSFWPLESEPLGRCGEFWFQAQLCLWLASLGPWAPHCCGPDGLADSYIVALRKTSKFQLLPEEEKPSKQHFKAMDQRGMSRALSTAWGTDGKTGPERGGGLPGYTQQAPGVPARRCLATVPLCLAPVILKKS